MYMHVLHGWSKTRTVRVYKILELTYIVYMYVCSNLPIALYTCFILQIPYIQIGLSL